jgi:uncharacterized protein YrzB (UPF0473 family)
MSEEFGANFITITDEDGNDLELEHLDTMEYNGQMYMAFLPAEMDEQDPKDVPNEDDMGLIILKVIQENGEELLSTLESEDELEAVYEKFMEELFEDEES